MYSRVIMDHFQNPRNGGQLSDHNARGITGDPNAGPFMVMYLKIVAGTIEKATFQTYGCPPAIAAGSVLTELIIGRTVDEAAGITEAQLLELLGGVPLGKEHCPRAAVGSLRAALEAFSRSP